MTKLAPEWVRTNDPVIRSPARYRWTTAPANAWMEDVRSVDWFEGVFLANIGPERPQILIWDSHRSHESLQIIHKARENNIILFTFPPHTTHFLCPLDRTVFGPFQRSYNTICSTYMSSDLSNTIKKSSVCVLLKDAFAQAFTRRHTCSSSSAGSICHSVSCGTRSRSRSRGTSGNPWYDGAPHCQQYTWHSTRHNTWEILPLSGTRPMISPSLLRLFFLMEVHN